MLVMVHLLSLDIAVNAHGVVGLLFLPDEIVIGSWSCCTVCHIRALDIFVSLAASLIGDYIDEYLNLSLI
jgi:hypothetical protein